MYSSKGTVVLKVKSFGDILAPDLDRTHHQWCTMNDYSFFKWGAKSLPAKGCWRWQEDAQQVWPSAGGASRRWYDLALRTRQVFRSMVYKAFLGRVWALPSLGQAIPLRKPHYGQTAAFFAGSRLRPLQEGHGLPDSGSDRHPQRAAEPLRRRALGAPTASSRCWLPGVGQTWLPGAHGHDPVLVEPIPGGRTDT